MLNSRPSRTLSGKSFFLIFLLTVYFTFFGGSLYTLTNFPLKVFNHLLVTVILGGWLLRSLLRSGSGSLPKTPLDWPLLFWLAVQLLAAALSIYPRFSFEGLWQPLTHALAFYLIVDLRWTYGRQFVRALYLTGAVVCLVGLIEFASWYFGLPLLAGFQQGWPQIGGLLDLTPPYWYRLNFTLNGATSLSAYLALLIPPALALRLSSEDKDERQALLAWLILAVVVEGLTFSRGGVLALGVSLPVFFLGGWLLKRPGWQSTLSLLPAKVVWGGLGLLLLAGLAGAGLLQQRLADHGSGDQVRLSLWQSAARMALDRPLTGVGPKLYGRALREYRDPAQARDQITTAHNLYLNTAAETGLLGLLAGGWLLGALAVAARRTWRARPDPAARLRLLGVAAALLGFGAQSMVDTFTATQIVWPVLLGAAFLIAPARPATGQAATPARHPRWVAIPLLGLLLAYALFLARWDLAQFRLRGADRLAAEGDLAGALAAAERARRLDPGLALYRFETAYYQGRLALSEPAYLPRAIDGYRSALALEATNPNYQANLAGLLWQAGQPQEAIRAMQRALALSPSDPVYLVNLGHFYEELGDEAQALEYYGLAGRQLPDLAGSGLWEPEMRQRVIETARGQTDDLRVLSALALAGGDPEEAKISAKKAIIAKSERRQPYVALARALLAQNRFEAVETLVSEQLPAADTATRGSLYLLRGQARWLRDPANEAAALKDLKTALFIDPFANAPAYYYLGQIYEARGDLERAKQAYARAVPPQFVSQNYEVVLYGRTVGHPPLLLQLLPISQDEDSARPWLRLIELYESEGQIQEAALLKEQLQARYPYLSIIP